MCRYFLGACDDGVKVYDFETGQLLHSYAELFSCYCDCVQFAHPAGMPTDKGVYYILVRGVELLKDDTNRSAISVSAFRSFAYSLRYR